MNIFTNSMERLTKMVEQTDEKLKQMGTEPYGVRRLTDKEQRERYENLTPNGLLAMIREHGVDETNKFLSKFMPKEGNDGNLV